MSNFNAGDLVQLLSGGPTMTVQEVFSTKLRCHWFSGKKLESGLFAPESLKRVEPDDLKPVAEPKKR